MEPVILENPAPIPSPNGAELVDSSFLKKSMGFSKDQVSSTTEASAPHHEGEAEAEPSGAEASAPPAASSDAKVDEQEKLMKKHEQRIKDLETALTESRKIIRDRETLLAQVQWRPKEDFYVWKNPKITDKQVKDALEKRLQTLVDQMRVMEKVIGERDSEIEHLANCLAASGDLRHTPSASPNGSPSSSSTFTSPIASPNGVSPRSSPSHGWNRSPGTSPAGSPQRVGERERKRSWWNVLAPRRSSLQDSPRSATPSPQPSQINVHQPQPQQVQVNV